MNGVATYPGVSRSGASSLDTGLAGFKLIGGLRYTSEKTRDTHDDNDEYSPLVSEANAANYAGGDYVTPQTSTTNKISWTAGLQNQISSNLLLYLSSHESFRSGGFNLDSPPTPGYSDTGGAAYKPEVATDIEFGAKYSGHLGDTPVRANIAAYNMWVKDIQRAFYAVIGSELAGITVNVPQAIVSGFELDGNILPTHWLSLGGNLNFTDARFTQNQVVVAGVTGGPVTATFDTYPDTPRWSGLAYSEVSIPVNPKFNAVLRGDVYYQTSTYFSSTGLSLNKGTQIPAYSLANFRVGIEPSTDKGWSVSALVKNAFSRVYYTGGIGFASLFSYNIAGPGEPRMYVVEAGYRF